MLVRISQQATPEAILEDRNKEAFELGVKKGRELTEGKIDYKNKEIQDLKKKINDFEKASGIEISGFWHKPEEVGRIVKSVLEGTYSKELERLNDLKQTALDIAKSIDDILKKKAT